MRLCPSQNEEMVPIGALCYSNTLIFRDDLKKAITSHPLGTPSETSPHPIFNIYVSDFNAPIKETKMLFVSFEKSQQEEVSSIFKAIYDGTKKITQMDQ